MNRRSIYVDGFSHENPIPAACQLGGLVTTGAVHGGGSGSDPDDFPARFGDQVAAMFDRVAAILTAAGGSLDDVLKFSVRISSPEDRDELNRQWCALFPDPSSRPARQVSIGTTRPHILVQCEVLALVAGDGGGDA
ncbi:RidA family protein [Saccharopolyspora spinosa]|uniref:2-iminobutanoate/2-iminopropanoate deaminase n=1 Tax=Saccharopolyspora spinosa TaxID=60894 RepID=A0A2N3XUH5_SACSN|nr:RidA family protein [Saccharopolyspora spinosa]PKW14338.1 2-iminobutanoate/2-iminopropanoate deaminase [Saccharopolyspora spinosa]